MVVLGKDHLYYTVWERKKSKLIIIEHFNIGCVPDLHQKDNANHHLIVTTFQEIGIKEDEIF